VINAEGRPVAPSLESVSAAAGGVDLPPDTDFRISIVNAPGAASYPISSFTWLLVRPTAEDPEKGAALKQFLEWMVTPEAQQQAAALQYAPLPESVRTLMAEQLKAVR